MNTQQSTDLLPELADALAQAPQVLAQREDEYQRLMAERLAAAAAELAAEWAGPLARLRAALPEWIYPFIEQPTARYRRIDSDGYIAEYTYVRIAVPGCNPIAAWVSPNAAVSPTYEAMQPAIYEDDDGVWCVYDSPRHDRRSEFTGETDIAVALFQAHEAMFEHLEIAEDARRRNAAAEAEAVPMDQPEPADPIDQALALMGKLSRNEPIKQVRADDYYADTADDRTLALATVGLAVAHHLRRTADALERTQWSR